MPLYVPRHNREEDLATLHAFLRAYPFATLVSGGDDGPEATHLPLLFDADGGANGVLIGHMARANDQWKRIERHPDVLAIFHGPHAFVSAAWYSPPGAISTWNYAVVHVRGQARVTHDVDDLHALVERARVAFDTPDTRALPYDGKLLRAIVGIEIEVTRLDGRFKLEQKEHPDDQARVRARLAEGDEAARQIAEMMTRCAPSDKEKG